MVKNGNRGTSSEPQPRLDELGGFRFHFLDGAIENLVYCELVVETGDQILLVNPDFVFSSDWTVIQTCQS